MELQQKAVEAALLDDGDEDKLLHGLWLHGELARLDESGIPASCQVDFMATVKILLDEVLPVPEEEKSQSGLYLP